MTDMKAKRVFLIVLDSLGIGEMPDAERYGDAGSNTLNSVMKSPKCRIPNLIKLGLFNIEGTDGRLKCSSPLGSFGRFSEKSNGKDTTTGHWEICGLITKKPFPVYPDGFPREITERFIQETGRGILCNKPYSGTKVLLDYGQEHLKTGSLIIYTSSDSVFQIAAHKDIVPVEKLYEYCKIARGILTDKHAVGRVIARPFTGNYPCFVRTPERHDFSLEPPCDTVLDCIKHTGLDVISIGKIYDIFAGKGTGSSNPTVSNSDGLKKTAELAKRDFSGLCFVNLVDFDTLYGHRNDRDGYAAALSDFDLWLGEFMKEMRDGDVLMLTSDHGCDPDTPSTDHSREYTFLLCYGKGIKSIDLGTRDTFADIGKTAADLLGVNTELCGKSFKELIT